MKKRFLAATVTGLALASFGTSSSQAQDPLGYQARLGRQNVSPTVTVQYGIPHARYYRGRYTGNYGPSCVTNYGHNRYVRPRHQAGHYDWHDTSHYDYHPGYIQRHGFHYHYVPGHYDFHRDGHYDYHPGYGH